MTNIMAEQQESTREPGIDRQRVAGEVEEQREHIKASNGPEDEKNGHKRPLSGRARHHLLSAICGARIARQGTGRKGEMCLRRSEEHTSELQSLMRISYAVFCLKKKTSKLKNAIIKYKAYSRTTQQR